MTYNFHEIHLADPGYEMQPFCNATQRLCRILTIPSLGPIQDEGVSVMALTVEHIGHDEQSEMRESETRWRARRKYLCLIT